MPNLNFGELLRHFLPGFVVVTSCAWLLYLLGDAAPNAQSLLALLRDNPVVGAFVYSTVCLFVGLVLNSLLFAFAFDWFIRDWSKRHDDRRTASLEHRLKYGLLVSSRRELLRTRLEDPRWGPAKLARSTARSKKQFELLQEEVLNRVAPEAFAVEGALRGDYLPDFYLAPPQSRDTAAAADDRYFQYTQFQFNTSFALFTVVPVVAVSVAQLTGRDDWRWLFAMPVCAMLGGIAWLCLAAARKNYGNYLRARNSWLICALQQR